MQKRLWVDAEKAFLDYSRQMPEPPRRAEAMVKAGQCRLQMRDAAGARRHFEKTAYDDAARRKSPEAVAEAFDRLHALLVAEGKSAALRARVIDDCRLRLPACAALPQMREREGDALLAANQPRQALDFFAAAGAGLSPGGTNVVRLLRDGLTGNPPPLTDADAARIAAAAEAKPACAAALCALLAKRGEGWLAEDVRALLLLRSGKAVEASAIWDAMRRGRRGPPDRIALSRAEALASGDPKTGLEAYRAWLAEYPNSPLRERVEAEYALLIARHGDLAEAVGRLEAFLGRHPDSRYAAAAKQALESARNAGKRLDQIAAMQAAKGAAQARDPALAEVEGAESLLAKGRYDAAAKGFTAFKDRRRHPLWGRAWFGLGKARHALGDTEGALAAWDDLWQRSPADTNVLYAAEARRAAGDAWLEDLADPARALQAYEDASARAPAGADAAFDLSRGLALLMLGRGAEAGALFTRRRDAVAADKVEFLRWDNLIKLCAGGRLKPPPRGLLSAERRALADLALADGLFAAGEHSRALRLYRRAAAPLAGREGADQCDLQTARTLAALDRTKDALALYARFEREHRQSPLAPGALLRAGTLCAAPRMSDFAKAREWFAKTIDNHPGTPEAEAAEFYTATLAWRARKWTEAATLHKAFAAVHPDSPLARVALDERLPAIAKKSLAVPLHAPVDRVVTVYVRPHDRKRKAIPIEKTTAYNAHLDIIPANGYALVDSGIIDQDSREVGILWTGPDPKTPTLHRYHLCDAFSSQEYVMIDGTLAKPGPGGGGGGRLPPFRVTVPSVDVDWVGFTNPTDESDEETRFVIVPLNTNRVDDIRRLKLYDPFDDDERNLRPHFPYGHPVNPDITLHWEAGNTLGLLDGDKKPFANGTTINAKATTWPLDFTVITLQPAVTFKIYAKGQVDDFGEKAVDNIHGRVVNVDLDVEADGKPNITDTDEPLEETPGGYVCVCTNRLTTINLTLAPNGLLGKLTLSANVDDRRIKVWQDVGRTVPVPLPKVWNAGAAIPGTLYVEGITNSANARDVELRLEYNENPPGQDNPLFKCADVVRLTVIAFEFVDDKPDYALGEDEDTPSNTSDNDSDNFFFRQHDQTSGDSDYKDINIYYRIMPAGIDVSDVKINVYEEDTGTKVIFGADEHLDGDTDASGEFKTGDNLHIKWQDVRDASGNFRDVGFYRLELEVYFDESTSPICKTPIADADTSMPGWQCPQKGLGIHDLAYKHRPVVRIGAGETVAPNGPVYPFSAGIKNNLRLQKDVFGPDGPAWSSPPANYSSLSSFPSPAANFKDYNYRYPVIEASRDNDGANSDDHYIDIDDANRGCALGVPFLCHRGHPSPSGAADYAFVQYWGYESASHSPYHLTFPAFNNTFTHEADWEMVQICVRLKDISDAGNKAKWLSPYAATASQHYYGQTLAWRRDVNGPAIVDQRYVTHQDDGNRVIIYVAENAHATYFRGGSFEVTVTAGCGTQVQYSPTYSLYFDSIAAPFTQVDCDLLPFNYKVNGGVNMKAICDWNGNWGEEPTFTPAIPGPFRRTVNIDGGGAFILNDDPVQYHNRCRKRISGTQDSETGL